MSQPGLRVSTVTGRDVGIYAPRDSQETACVSTARRAMHARQQQKALFAASASIL